MCNGYVWTNFQENHCFCQNSNFKRDVQSTLVGHVLFHFFVGSFETFSNKTQLDCHSFSLGIVIKFGPNSILNWIYTEQKSKSFPIYII